MNNARLLNTEKVVWLVWNVLVLPQRCQQPKPTFFFLLEFYVDGFLDSHVLFVFCFLYSKWWYSLEVNLLITIYLFFFSILLFIIFWIIWSDGVQRCHPNELHIIQLYILVYNLCFKKNCTERMSPGGLKFRIKIKIKRTEDKYRISKCRSFFLQVAVPFGLARFSYR